MDDFEAALRLLIRRARGDHSPDSRPEQFPQASPDAHGGLPGWDLFVAWEATAKPKPATVLRWRAVFLKLQEDFRERPIASLSFQEALEWVQALVNAKRSAATVADVWLSAARTVCAWGKLHQKITHNPFAGLPFKATAKPRLREDAFTAQETQTILSAALGIGNTHKPFNAVKRWVPWLCAYSGARVGEIIRFEREEPARARCNVVALVVRPATGPLSPAAGPPVQ